MLLSGKAFYVYESFSLNKCFRGIHICHELKGWRTYVNADAIGVRKISEISGELDYNKMFKTMLKTKIFFD